MAQLSLQFKISLAFALALALLMAVAAISWFSIQHLRADSRWVAHTQQVLTQLTQVLATATDIETAMRGYALTGDQAYLQPHEHASAVLDGQLAQLRALSADNPRQRSHMRALLPAVAARVANANAVVRAGREQGLDAAQAIIRTGEGKRLHDRIRAVVGQMLDAETALLPPREAQARSMAQFALTSIVAGALLAALVGGGALLAVNGGFARLRLGELRLRRSNRGLQRASQRAQQSDRLKSAFLATMSHELRTPLNSIIGFTGILLQGLAGPLNPEQGKQLGMVQTSARHLLALINDVLDISKIEAGELQVACQPFDLHAALTRVADIMRPLAQAKGLGLRLELPPLLPAMRGDQRRVEQIVLNLLSNAVKFSERGEVVLTAVAQAQQVCVRVRDSGIGIKPEDMQTLFLPFRQIDTGLARLHEGTGLGLAICRRLASLMGGEIRAESTWGEGSTFTFMLPCQGAPHA